MASGLAPYSRSRRRARGYSLPLVFCFVMILFALGAASFWRVQHELSSRSNHERGVRARYAARTGLQRALAKLSEDSSWQPARFDESLGGGLSFQVEILNNFAQTNPAVAPDGSEVPAGRVWLRSTGLVDGQPARGLLGQATALPIKPPPIFNFVVDERQPLKFCTTNFVNSWVDSYSGVVPRAYSPTLNPGSPATYTRAARIHSDSQVLIQRGGGFVDAEVVVPQMGQAELAAGAFSGLVNSDPSWIPTWKFCMPRRFRTQPSSSPPNSGTLSPGRYSELSVPAGQTLLLRAGVYYFPKLTLGAGARLVLDPGVSDSNPCVVYVGEEVQLGESCEVNLDAPPRHLQIYMCDERADETSLFTFRDSSKLSAVFAGRNLSVLASDHVEIWGAFRCFDFYEGRNTKLHYDTSLRDQVLQGDAEWVLLHESA